MLSKIKFNGKKLVIWRKDHGYSQEDIALMLHNSVQTIHNIENDIYNIRFDILVKLLYIIDKPLYEKLKSYTKYED